MIDFTSHLLQGKVLAKHDNDNKSQMLSLTAWMPWQSRLQTTGSVGHSTATEDFVQIMEFLDVQGIVLHDCLMISTKGHICVRKLTLIKLCLLLEMSSLATFSCWALVLAFV